MLKPWITSDILKKCDEKNKLVKEQTKKAYFAKRFMEHKNNSSKVW